jgi:hypothetical protein
LCSRAEIRISAPEGVLPLLVEHVGGDDVITPGGLVSSATIDEISADFQDMANAVSPSWWPPAMAALWAGTTRHRQENSRGT